MTEQEKAAAFAICRGFWAIDGMATPNGPCECERTGRTICPNMRNAANSVLRILPILQLRAGSTTHPRPSKQTGAAYECGNS